MYCTSMSVVHRDLISLTFSQVSLRCINTVVHQWSSGSQSRALIYILRRNYTTSLGSLCVCVCWSRGDSFGVKLAQRVIPCDQLVSVMCCGLLSPGLGSSSLVCDVCEMVSLTSRSSPLVSSDKFLQGNTMNMSQFEPV